MKSGIIAVLVVCLLAGWWLYDLGKLHGVDELESLRTKNAILEDRNNELSDAADKLREQAAVLERSGQIDRQAAEDIQLDLGQLEEELQAAREEVEFYRGIVSPGDVRPGLRIHRFSLESGTEPGEYHYELVLTQLKRNDRYVSGKVDWKITGSLQGEQGEVGLAGVTDPAVKQLKFRFRYFQGLAGTISLPDNFVAEKVELTIKPAGKTRQEPVVQVFDWPPTGS
jgi:hypothetical protein